METQTQREKIDPVSGNYDGTLVRDKSRIWSAAASLGFIPGTSSLGTASAGSGGGGSGVQLRDSMMSGSSEGVAAGGGGSLEGMHNCRGDNYEQLSDDKGSHLYLNFKERAGDNLDGMVITSTNQVIVGVIEALGLKSGLSNQKEESCFGNKNVDDNDGRARTVSLLTMASGDVHVDVRERVS